MFDKNLLRLLGDTKKYIFYTAALMLVGLFANISVTASICYAIHLAIHYDTYSSAAIFLLPALCAAVGILVRYSTTRLVGNLKNLIGRNAKKDLREKVYNKILRLGVRSTDDISMAGLTQISMEGIEQLDLYYSSYIPQFFYAMAAPIILFFITVWIDWRVALVLLAGVPLIPLSIIAVSKYAKKIFAKYWGKYTSMGDSFLDSVQGLRELKIFKADEAQHKKMNEHAEEFRKITMKVLVMQLASTTIMDMVAYGGAGIGVALAVMGMINRGLSPIAALFLILVAVDFFLPLRAFGAAFHIAMNGASAGKKILSLLEQADPVWGNESPSNTEIKIENVSFSYDGQRNILQNVTMTFPQKGMTAIVGESGCGKSTIVGLLSGGLRHERYATNLGQIQLNDHSTNLGQSQRNGHLTDSEQLQRNNYETDSAQTQANNGTITIGGKALHTLSRESYYSRLAVISYNTYIFNETVRANFLLANANVSDEDIYLALEQVNLADFIRSNGGLDKKISEDASNISGGQKQRLALAVNLVANKGIYIFDEATSNIDIESESIIMKNIKELSRQKSVIVISHRLANVVPSDFIYFMDAGEIKEYGTHDSLMKTNGGYAKLYKTQKHLENDYKEVIT